MNGTKNKMRSNTFVSDNTFARCISSDTSMLLRTGLALRQGNTEVLRNLQNNPCSTVCFTHMHFNLIFQQKNP